MRVKVAVTCCLVLLASMGCDRGKATKSGEPPASEAAGAAEPTMRAPAAIKDKAQLSVGQKVTVCWRSRGKNPFAANDEDYTCGATLEAKKAPFGTGVNGKQVFDSLRGVEQPPPLKKLWAKSPGLGEDPKGICSAIGLADADDEWFDNYVFVDEAGKAWMFLEIDKS